MAIANAARSALMNGQTLEVERCTVLIGPKVGVQAFEFKCEKYVVFIPIYILVIKIIGLIAGHGAI
jgi:hypothetical protein